VEDYQIHPSQLPHNSFSCLYIKLFYYLNGNYPRFCYITYTQSISEFSQQLKHFAERFNFDCFANYFESIHCFNWLSAFMLSLNFKIQVFIFCSIFIMA